MGTTKEAELKEKCCEQAQVAVSQAINNAFNEIWKARNRAEKDGKEEYGASVKLTIKNKGEGKANVGAEVSWNEPHKLKLADKEVSIHPDLFEKGEGGETTEPAGETTEPATA